MKNKNTEKSINFKLSKKDYKALKVQAEKFTNGNLSAWLRIAGLEYDREIQKKLIEANVLPRLLGNI